MSDNVEQHQRRLREAVADALARGQAAVAEGALQDAERWLDRARRVAGGNDTIELLLASVRLRRGNLAAAAEGFAALAKRHDLREAWIGLAATRLRAGQPDLAAAALAELLAGHAIRLDAQLQSLIDAIVTASGAPGWCGIGPDRSVIAWSAAQPIEATLDGNPHSDLAAPLPVRARRLRLHVAGRSLLGSPLRIDRALRLEGFVQASAGDLSGWAWHPNDPETPPLLTLLAADGTTRSVHPLPPDAAASHATERHDRPLAQPRPFHVPAHDLPAAGLVRVTGPDGRDLPGSPLDPVADQQYASAVAHAVAGRHDPPAASHALRHAPVPVGSLGRHHPAAPPATPRAVTVVVPSYRGHATTLACLETVLANSDRARIVVVDDAGPEPDLAAALDVLAAAGHITLIRNPENLGFPRSANAGILAAGADDVVLLNSDTLVPPGWLAALRTAAYAAENIGSATPISNDATLLSYPNQAGDNPIPAAAATARLARLAARANPGGVVDIPTGVGFCMYLRRDCLDQVGLLREDAFAQGYAEENDWCLRARTLGWRHVAATATFVAHIGGQSFGAARTALLTRNLATLNRLHPGYDELIAADESGPALAATRRRLDLAILATRQKPASSVILITHDLGGGVQRQVDVRRAALAAAGDTPIVLRPILARPLLQGTGECIVDLAPDLPNLVFRVDTELGALTRLLAAQRPRRIELHHMLGHDHRLMDLPRRLKIPYEVHIHDYAWFCPRVSLIGSERRYCGEPDIAGCEACIADNGRNIDDEIPVAALVARSAIDLAGADTIIAATADTAARLHRHFPAIRAEVRPWDDSRPNPSQRPKTATRTIGILGAIGIEKGYDVLIACARDAATRALPLHFVVIGHTTDDRRLLDTQKVFITGEYTEADLPTLIADHNIHLAFLPSIWPETWCFTLSEAWRARLHTVAFDIGAPADRIKTHGGGTLIPLNCRAPQINASLLTCVAGQEGKASGSAPAPRWGQTPNLNGRP